MKKPYTEEEKDSMITSWQSSGLSQTKWCAREGISRRTFGNWLKKKESAHGHQEQPTAFVPIEMPGTEESMRITLCYPNGVQLHCPAELNTTQLSRLIGLLD